MVDNVAGDDVKPKPAKNKASGEGSCEGALYPPKCTIGVAPVDKWMTTPDMGHIIASC